MSFKELWNLTDLQYERIKAIAMVYLPALTAFVVVIMEVCGIPYAVPVAAIMAGLDACLGKILQYSTENYNKNTK